MIKLTLLDGSEALVNPEHVKKVISSEPVTIVFSGGQQIYVRETPLRIHNLIRDAASQKEKNDQ